MGREEKEHASITSSGRTEVHALRLPICRRRTQLARWVIRRKAMVVAAVQGGLITLDDACIRRASARSRNSIGLARRHAALRHGRIAPHPPATIIASAARADLFPLRQRPRCFHEFARHHHHGHGVLLGTDLGQHLHRWRSSSEAGVFLDLVRGLPQQARLRARLPP